MFFQNLRFILPSFQQFLLKILLLVSHKVGFFRKRGCVTMRKYAETCKGICSYDLVRNFSIQLLSLQSSDSVVLFSNAFWHGNESFLKRRAQNEIVPLLIIFYLVHSLYRGVKICFHSCRYQNQTFSFVSFVQHSCRTRVGRFSFVSHSCRWCLALVLQNRLALLIIYKNGFIGKTRLISKFMTNLRKKQLQYTYCPISQEVKALRQ